MNSNEITLLTPIEIFQEIPEAAKRWSGTQLGYLLYCEVLRGRKIGRTCIVNKHDVIELIEHLEKRD